MFEALSSFIGLDKESSLRKVAKCESAFEERTKLRGTVLSEELEKFCRCVRGDDGRSTVAAIRGLETMKAIEFNSAKKKVILFYLAVAYTKTEQFADAEECCTEFEMYEFANSQIKELKDIIEEMRPLKEKSWFGPTIVGVAAAGVATAWLATRSLSSSDQSEDMVTENRGDPYKDVRDNRSRQLNLEHPASGPGRPAGYHGFGTKDDLDNRSRQRNPNNSRYQ